MLGRFIITRIEKTANGFETKHGVETADGIFELEMAGLEGRFDLSIGSTVEVWGEKHGKRLRVHGIRALPSAGRPIRWHKSLPVV